MATYNYTKAGVHLVNAFSAYLVEFYPDFLDFTYTDPELIVHTTAVLNPTQETEAQAVVDAYTDPAEWLSLRYTTTDFTWSKATSASTPTAVQTFIFSPNTPTAEGSTFDSLKTVMSYSTDDIAVFTTDPGTCTATYELYDQTRATVLASYNIDITDILATWYAEAQASGSGPRTVLRSFMVQGLRHVTANYDCIWQFRYAVTDARVIVRSHGIQSLFYTMETP